MTPRSRRYFTRQRRLRYQESALVVLMPIFEAYGMCIDAMKKLAEPTARYYPAGTQHPVVPAIVGEIGPEIIKKESMWDVTIKNPFTPFAEGTYVKIKDYD